MMHKIARKVKQKGLQTEHIRVIPNKHNRCMSGDVLKSPSNFNH